jgi:alkylation response protein AidB-like acyl-CoA dehydrogenase
MSHAGLTESARMILDSAIEFAEGSGGPLRARAMRDKPGQLDRRTWQQILGLGWPLVAVAEEHGGLALGLDCVAALAEGTSRMLLPEPLLANVVGAALLSACAGNAVNPNGAGPAAHAAHALLDELMDGARLAVPVFPVTSGKAPMLLKHVPDCYDGTTLLVAKDSGKRFCIRAVAIDAAGVMLHSAACVDGSMLSDVEITAPAWDAATTIAEGPAARAAFALAHDSLLIGYAAALVGVMDEALQQTIEYMKVRQQFGTPIGSFQALQHRAASCHVDIQAAGALVYEACKAARPDLRARAAVAAKARASAAGLRVTKECVQFHGAIGFADEHNIGLYLKKAMALAARLGGEVQQRARYAQLLVAADANPH